MASDLDAWNTAIEKAIMAAASEWAPRVLHAALPTLTAAGLPPDPDRMDDERGSWWRSFVTNVLPVLAGLMAARTSKTLRDRGITPTPPELESAAAAIPWPTDVLGTLSADDRADLITSFAELRQTLGDLLPDDAELIVRIPSWRDNTANYLSTVSNRCKNMPDTVFSQIRTALAEGIDAGEDAATLAVRVREHLDMGLEGGRDAWNTRAARIARTESTGAYNASTLEAARIEQDETGTEMHKVWMCVHPDTIVGTSDALRGARRRYEGTLVKATTASGRTLSLTPEHPVLTGRGWVPAGLLDESDHLFHIAPGEPSGAPDVDNGPSTIGELVDATMKSMPSEVRTVCSGVDLDVDPSDGDVEVVPVDRDLSARLETSLSKSGRKLRFETADTLGESLVLRERCPIHGRTGLNSSPISGGDGGVPARLALRGLQSGTNDPGGRLVSEFDSSPRENLSDQVMARAYSLADRPGREPVLVGGNDVLDVEVGPSSSFDCKSLGSTGLLDRRRVVLEPQAGPVALAADRHASFVEAARDGGVVGTHNGGDLPEGLTGLVEADDLVHVERYTFVGHVYDLETVGHWYSANDLVVHNCTLDPRTRDTHIAADGQRVPLDEQFLIGGERLSYPGDPNGSAASTVNCRCTILELAADEPLPGEDDRQTERTRSDGSRRNPAAEVAGRAADGVTRAREDPAGVGYIAAAGFEEDTMRRPFSGVLAPVGKPTGDGRILDSDGVFRFRDFPLPLMWQKSTSEGHDQSVIVGRIDTASVEGGEIVATGVLFESAEAAEAGQLLADEVVRPSVDLCDMVADFLILDADGATVDPEQIDPDQSDGLREMTVVREATVMAATLVAKPAFAEAKLALGEPTDDEGADAEETLLASAGATTMARIDPAAFAAPDLTQPTGLTVTDDGRVYGHLALFDSCHVGMQDRCVTPPRTGSDYAYFHTSTVDTPAGPVSVGRLTVGCGHAQARAGLHAAAEHYDDTGTCWAYVRAGEDAHGIWVAGIVNPDASETSIRAGASAPLSGDWRTVGGRLELVAALSVNTPGFPVPRTYAADNGRSMSLVAAGAVQSRTRRTSLGVADMQAVAEAAVDAYVVRQQRATEAAQIRSRIAAREAARLTARHKGNR